MEKRRASTMNWGSSRTADCWEGRKAQMSNDGPCGPKLLPVAADPRGDGEP